MNHREPTSVPRGTGQALPCLALLLLPLLAVARAWSRPMLPPQAISSDSKPYLGAIGAPPLRFQEPAPPPDLVTRPSAAAPPRPASKEESADVTVAESHPNPAPLGTAAPPPTSTDSAVTSGADPSAPPRTPPPILRDEIHHQTRAEDFLPFFQIPATQPGDVNAAAVPRAPSAPAPLPTSSATYTQTPR
jgi:hypothetical protein